MTEAVSPAKRAEFWSKVDKADPDGCWLWTGTKVPSGYGRLWIAQRPFAAHRVAYEWLVGPIPEGLQLDHLCRVRRCVNPAHLEPVTSRENTMRGLNWAARNAEKTHCPQGHPYDEANTYLRSGGGRGCRACHREAARAQRQRKTFDPVVAERAGHGKASTYRYHGCRCRECRAANSADVAAYRARRRERDALAEIGGPR